MDGNVPAMAEWRGQTIDEPGLTEEQRLIRPSVMRLVDEGGCKTDLAQSVVTDLVDRLTGH